MTLIITTINDSDKLGKLYENYALSLMLPWDEEVIDTKQTLNETLKNFDVKKYKAEVKARNRHG